MDDNFLGDIENWLESSDLEEVPIPKAFYSAYDEKPFKKCLVCEESLIKPPKIYEIQKVYRGGEVIFEYAICSKCSEITLKEYSRESIQQLQEFIMNNFVPSNSVKHCNLCGKAKEESHEYSITSLCRGNSLLNTFFLCDTCMEDLDKLISDPTRKAIEDFVTKNFPGISADFPTIPMIAT